MDRHVSYITLYGFTKNDVEKIVEKFREDGHVANPNTIPRDKSIVPQRICKLQRIYGHWTYMALSKNAVRYMDYEIFDKYKLLELIRENVKIGDDKLMKESMFFNEIYCKAGFCDWDYDNDNTFIIIHCG